MEKPERKIEVGAVETSINYDAYNAYRRVTNGPFYVYILHDTYSTDVEENNKLALPCLQSA